MRGIYAITNVLTDTVYYGQTVDIRKRLATHASKLLIGTHTNPLLQASWNKYGKDAFVFAPLYSMPDGDLTARERSCCEDAYGLGLKKFNCFCPGEPPMLGRKMSAETREKMSAASHRKRHPHSAETRARISDGRRKNLLSPLAAARLRKISAANVGRKASDEHCSKISVAQKLRWERNRAVKEGVPHVEI